MTVRRLVRATSWSRQSKRRHRDAKIVGRQRLAEGSASRHEIGQGAKLYHRISKVSCQHRRCTDCRTRPSLLPIPWFAPRRHGSGRHGRHDPKKVIHFRRGSGAAHRRVLRGQADVQARMPSTAKRCIPGSLCAPSCLPCARPANSSPFRSRSGWNMKLPVVSRSSTAPRHCILPRSQGLPTRARCRSWAICSIRCHGLPWD